MSSQSIVLNTIEKYSEETNKILIYNFEQYFYSKNFKLGLGANMEEMSYYRHLKELFCDNNCEIANCIQNKLQGNPQEVNKRRKLHTCMEEYEREHEIIDTKNYWTENLWD